MLVPGVSLQLSFPLHHAVQWPIAAAIARRTKMWLATSERIATSLLQQEPESQLLLTRLQRGLLDEEFNEGSEAFVEERERDHGGVTKRSNVGWRRLASRHGIPFCRDERLEFDQIRLQHPLTESLRRHRGMYAKLFQLTACVRNAQWALWNHRCHKISTAD